MIYVDKNDNEIKAGDILKYHSGSIPGYKSIDYVIEQNGVLFGVERVSLCDEWQLFDDDSPCEIEFYADDGDEPFVGDVEIIGNITDTPERLTPEYARIIFNKE